MEFCDLKCRFARWPDEEGLDGSGSCRTFQAVFCAKQNRLVHKNAPCAHKEKATSEGAAQKPAPSGSDKN